MANRLIQIPPAHARIDWTHPITRGLTIAFHSNCIFANTLNGSGITIANGGRLRGTTGGIKNADYYTGNGSTQGVINFGSILDGSEQAAVFSLQWDSAGGGGYARVYENGIGYVATASTTRLDIVRVTTGTASLANMTIPSGYNQEWHIYGANYPNSTTGSELEGYIDGIKQTLSTSNGTGSPGNNDTITTHRVFDNGSNARIPDGRLKFFYLWKRKLSQGEHALLAADPYCFWTWEGKRSTSTIPEEPRVATKTSNFTTFANATRSSGAINLEWSNMSNAQASDNSRVSMVTINPPPASPYSGNTHYLKASQLVSTIPSSAIPLGVRIGIERNASGAGASTIKDSQVYIVKGGTIQTADNKADTSTNYPLTDTVKYYGAANDKWSQTWTASDINDSGFGVVLSVSVAQDMEDMGSPQIDQIFTEITYIGDDATSWTGEGSANIALTTSSGGLRTAFGAGSPSLSVTSSGSGIGSFVGVGSSNITFTTTGTPKLTLQGSASPNINFAGYFQTVEFGAGSSTIAFTTSAIGSIPLFGAGSANIAFTGTSGGFKTANGTATALLAFASSMNGLRTAFGAASPTLALTSSAQGLKTLLGTSSGQISFVTNASGSRTTYGTASGSLSFASSMDGLRSVFGSASPTLAFTGQASALKTLLADASGIVAFTASTGTKLTASGNASAQVAFTCSAQALRTLLGTASADIALSALAIAAGTILGSGTVNVALTGQATALKTLLGSATPTVALTSNAGGTRIALGNAALSISVTGVTSGKLVLLGASQAQINLTAQALIDSGFVISFVDEFTMNIEWQESRKANLNAIGEFILPITPTKTFKGR